MAKQQKQIATNIQATTHEAVEQQPLLDPSFVEVIEMIQQARQQAFQPINTTLIDLYWRIGEYISRKMETADWGESVINQLAEYINRAHPDIKGFTRSNLFRMRQFFETYEHDEKVAPVVRQLPWTHNLLSFALSGLMQEPPLVFGA